ncbi:Pre-B lymphocyte protein 3 [Myotis brandtii]|uniref:Pre-B lymphocyte protein 3 n=1 Tax=Myotis brandtii TaxID=109478 RepID=S7N8C0_MYOBR|nr:PREDICTED: pre-B lymphocyte protein 3 [Myotis brandtii]EPQ13479.1 Pre-B lymphocyte protein 3 [Myotis brandtii]
MAWWCLALLLVGALLAVSQPVLTQPDALLVFPGQVVQISCMLNPRHANIGDYGVSWYQQRAGSAPRYLLYYRSKEDHHRSPDIPDRFSAATDAAQNACILIISPVQPEDDADYYCSVGYIS